MPEITANTNRIATTPLPLYFLTQLAPLVALYPSRSMLYVLSVEDAGIH